jgi:hypothetical protein
LPIEMSKCNRGEMSLPDCKPRSKPLLLRLGEKQIQFQLRLLRWAARRQASRIQIELEGAEGECVGKLGRRKDVFDGLLENFRVLEMTGHGSQLHKWQWAPQVIYAVVDKLKVGYPELLLE